MRYCFERTQFGFAAPEQEAARTVYKSLVGKYPANTVLLNCRWPIECMYYTNYIAYSKKQLSALEENTLREKGYTPLYLNDNGNAIAAH